jgi:hypothetical protein
VDDHDVLDAAGSLVAAAAALTDPNPTNALRAATGAFLDALDRSGGPVPTIVTDALATLPPIGAAWIAITLGSAVERGHAPAHTFEPILALVRRWLEVGANEIARAGADLAPDVVTAFPWVGQSVVAHLARLPARRAELAADTGLEARLIAASAKSYAAGWIHELLLRRSGDLVVLHVASRRGLAMRYENVGRCFHLFTLLQGAIGTRLPDGRAPDRELVDAAMGGAPTSRVDAAWWHYQDHTAHEAHFMHSLWAEWSIADIPEIDGLRVLVLWPPILSGRHWGADFFGPALEAAPPRVVIERELDRAQVEAWFARLGLPGHV